MKLFVICVIFKEAAQALRHFIFKVIRMVDSLMCLYTHLYFFAILVCVSVCVAYACVYV